jgi:hypothetical protein
MKDSERRTQRIHMEMVVLNIKFQRRKARSQPQAVSRRMRPVVLSRDMREAERQQREAFEFMHRQKRR